MGKIEQLAEKYKQHISLPWQHTVAGAQRVIMVVYDKELERSLMARKEAFAMATRDEGHEWFEVNVADSFAQWMAREEYRDAYFESPEDLQLKLEVEFAEDVAGRVRAVLDRPECRQELRRGDVRRWRALWIHSRLSGAEAAGALDQGPLGSLLPRHLRPKQLPSA